MKVAISILCIFFNIYFSSFSMDSYPDIHALCMKERVKSEEEKSATVFFVCLQDESVCKGHNSCCYQNKSCCRKIKTCCKKLTGCCGDQECGCTTDDNRIATVTLDFKAPMRIYSDNCDEDRFMQWLVKNAEKDKKLLVAYNGSGETILHIAARKGNAQLCQQILMLGANPNVQGLLFPRETPLHSAKEKEVMVVLCAIPTIDLEQKNVYGNTPLFVNIYRNNYDGVKFLLEQGAKIYHKNDMGHTALHYAGLQEASFDMVALLLEKGAYNLSSLCDVHPIEYMNESNSGAFEKYGYTFLDGAIYKLLKNNAFSIHKGLEKAKSHKKEKEGLAELQSLFKQFLALCGIKNNDLSPKERLQQKIYYSKYKNNRIICRYPSYELFCSYFGESTVELIKTLLS